MASAVAVIRNLYRDSVALMQLSSRIAQLPGMRQASAIMASAANLALLREAGLLDGPIDAGPNDIVIAGSADGDDALRAAMAAARAALDEEQPAAPGGGLRREPPRSLQMGLDAAPDASLALISAPGDYAAAEAMKALRLGLDVMIFSDGVAIEDEVALKRFARDRNLLVMGPDCGTAIIGGLPIGFANVVRRGDVGLVAASGTGLQQVICLIDRLGCGISQAIGTGSHDLAAQVGGVTMLQGLAALASDPATRVIVLVSKPPASEVAARVLAAARAAGKPVVVNFLGADHGTIAGGNLTAAATLDDAAMAAAALSSGRRPAPLSTLSPDAPRFAPGQRYVRGLYSGGTFCYEASLLLAEALDPVFTNTPVGRARPLADAWQSRGHALVDLGDDLFTRGRPHPMIDHRLRNQRMLREAEDAETAVVLLDVVLGYGAHDDPAGAMAPVIVEARARAALAGRDLAVLGFVCGTERDPQGLARQEAVLREAGMLLAPSNAQAVRLAARIAAQIEADAP